MDRVPAQPCVFMSALNHNFQVIYLTETCVKDTGIYNVIHFLKGGRKGGGDLLLIKKHLEYEVITEATVNLPFVESVFVKIRISNSNTQL